MAEQMKTPLLGDALYGRHVANPVIEQAARLIGRQALHAAELAFEHPVTGEHLEFRLDPPEDFARALDYLRSVSTDG
jgi:23S rRNA pseudouridine1911/1915/1917 synthase